MLDNRIVILLDQLDELVDNATKVPIVNKVMIDSETFLNILDDLRRSLPDEVKQARVIIDGREKIIADAQNQVKVLLEQAQKQAEGLLDEDEIARKGRLQAEEMVRQAENYYMEVRQKALTYTSETLQKLEEDLSVMLRQVRTGRSELAAREQR
jgi:hypothetical protein